MDIFTSGLVLLIVACAILYYYTGSVANKVNDQNFNKFQRLYLSVYLLAMSNFYFQSLTI